MIPGREKVPERNLWLLCGLLLATGVFALGLRTLGFDWLVFDDDINILFNPLLGGLAPGSLAGAFGDLGWMRRYLPLGYTLWDLELQVFGFSAQGFHLVSILLAGAGAFVLFLTARRFGALLGLRGRALEFSALSASALWWFHPMRAASIGWISGQLYLAASLFAFLAVYLLLATLSDGLSERRRGVAWWLSSLCYLASLLVYPVYLALAPLAGLLVWWQYRRRSRGGGALEGLLRALGIVSPWMLCSLAIGFLNTYAAHRLGGGFGALPGLASHPLPDRLLQAGAFLLTLLGRTVHYGPAAPYLGESLDRSVFGTDWMLGGLLLILLILPCWLSSRQGTHAWLVPVSLVLAVLPVCGLIDATTDPSDRYSVLPHLVLVFALMAAAAGSARLRVWLPVLGFLILLCLIPAHLRALKPWADTESLQGSLDEAAMFAQYPMSRDRFFGLCYGRAAQSLFYSGKVEEAQARVLRGLRIRPADPGLARSQGEFVELLRKDPVLGAAIGRQSLHQLQHLRLAAEWERQGNLRAAGWHRERARQLQDSLNLELRNSSGSEARAHPPAP